MTILKLFSAAAYILVAALAALCWSWLIVAEVRYFFSGILTPVDADVYAKAVEVIK